MATEVLILLVVVICAVAAAFVVDILRRRKPAAQVHHAMMPVLSIGSVESVLNEAQPSPPIVTESASVLTINEASKNVVDFDVLHSKLASASAETELAPVLLAKGQSLLKSGNTRDGAKALRAAIVVAVENGMADIHALARLELAEIARADGDLTTACEHWHLAKTQFAENNRKDSVASTDKHMKDHGCPTEWVLTDF
jgi:hypothetical protein